MSRPWMPLYIADYLAATAHLGAAQSGAYLHLIMHYWQAGSLPPDDNSLARIARMTVSEWKRNRPSVSAFFVDGWRHTRIDAELAKTADVAESYAARARVAASKRWAKHQKMDAPSMPQALLEQSLGMPISPSQSQKKEQEASERKRARGSRLPLEWEPSVADLDYAKSRGLDPNQQQIEALKFRNYWTAKAGAGGVKLDWSRTWQNWILNSHPQNGAQNGQSSTASSTGWLGIAQRRIAAIEAADD